MRRGREGGTKKMPRRLKKKGGREEARKRTASGIAKSSGKRPNATVAEADLKQCRSGKKEERGRESESVDPAPDLCDSPPPLFC